MDSVEGFRPVFPSRCAVLWWLVVLRLYQAAPIWIQASVPVELLIEVMRGEDVPRISFMDVLDTQED